MSEKINFSFASSIFKQVFRYLPRLGSKNGVPLKNCQSLNPFPKSFAAGKTIQIIGQSLAAFTGPTNLSSWISDDNGIIGNVFIYNRSDTKKAIATEAYTTDKRCVAPMVAPLLTSVGLT
jgi:hypothetical protein